MNIPRQRFSKYDRLLQRSWHELWRKPILFFPIMYRMLGFLVIGVLVILAAWLFIGPTTLITDSSLGAKVAFLAALFLSLLFFEFHVKSLQTAVFCAVASESKISLKKAFRESLPLYGKVFGTMMLILLTATVVFGVVTLLILMSVGLATETMWPPLIAILVGLIALGGFLLALFFSAWMVFWMPLVGFTKSSVSSIIRQCWKLLWQDSHHVWSTYLINLGISLGIGITLAVISTMVTGSSKNSPLWLLMIHFIVNAIISTWMQVFVFKSFFKRYKQQVR